MYLLPFEKEACSSEQIYLLCCCACKQVSAISYVVCRSSKLFTFKRRLPMVSLALEVCGALPLLNIFEAQLRH